MATFRLSRLAEADLLRIGEYSLRTWGEDRTIRYLEELERCCRMLANSPTLGRICDDIRPGLRRTESGQRVIFYRQDGRRILVSRILHERMLPERHTIDRDDES